MSRRRILLVTASLGGVILATILIQRLNRHLTHDPLAEAIAPVEQKGGKVGRDGDQPDSRVVSVRLIGRRFTDDDLGLLEPFPDLEELQLQGTAVTDDGLKRLRPLRALRRLNLHATAITDAGLAELQNHPELEELVLTFTRVTDAGLKDLTPLRKLRTLQVPPACYTPHGLRTFRDLGLVRDFPSLFDAHGLPPARPEDVHTFAFPLKFDARGKVDEWLAEMPSLRVIRVNAPLVTDELLRDLARLGKLHMLYVYVWPESDKTTFQILTREEAERFDKERPDRDEDITSFVLYRCSVTDECVDTLLPLKKRQTLELGRSGLTVRGFVRLAALPNLSRLSAEQVRLTAADLRPFKVHKRLTLDVEFDLSDAGLKAYREAGVLHLLRSGGEDDDEWVLNLSDSPLTDAGLDELRDFHEFAELRLSRTNVTDAGLARLVGHAQLKGLFLRQTRLTDAGLKHLAGLRNLERLDLDGVQVTDAGVKHLAGLAKLKDLDLQGTGIGDAGLKELAKLASLEVLNLRSTRVGDAGLKELHALPVLRKLDLRESEVTDAGLAELRTLTKLRELELWDTHVSEAGLGDLKAALPECHITGRARQGPR